MASVSKLWHLQNYPSTHCKCVKLWHQQNYLSTHWVWSRQACQTLTPTKSPIHPLSVSNASMSNFDTNKITYPPTECNHCKCVKLWHQQNHLSSHWVWALQVCQTLTPIFFFLIAYPPTECDHCKCVKLWHQQNHLSTHWVWSLQLCQTMTPTKSPIHPLSVITATMSNTDNNKITYLPTVIIPLV